MNESMIYIYLGIVMIVVLATAFYVRTVKNKMDTKVDAMFQLVQSMARELNSLKSYQHHTQDSKEIIDIDLASNENRIIVSENESSSDEFTDEDSDGNSSEQSDIINKNDLIDIEVTKLDTVIVDPDVVGLDNVNPELVETELVETDVVELDNVELDNVELDNVELDNVEIKEVILEPLEDQNYEALTVKELKELVQAKGGKSTGKKKADLIEYLTT